MAYVREDFSEEDKNKYNIPLGSFWLIDRESMFYKSGGNPRGPETTFAFIWKGEVLDAGGIWHETGIGKDKPIEWRDVIIHIPEHLKYERQEIIKALIDAFEAHGFSGYGEHKVRIIFDPKMNIIEADCT